LILGDDGGIYKRTNPTSSNGQWISLGGRLPVLECHSGDYDFETGLAICGAQDQGNSIGLAGDMFYKTSPGDGGVVALSRQTTPHKFYRTTQMMGYFGGGCTPLGQPVATINLTLPFPWTTSQVCSFWHP